MSNRDEYVLKQSMENMSLDNNFKYKTYHTIQDNNSSGSYNNNQVYFQLSSIYNLNKYFDWSNAYLLIPVNINVKCSEAKLKTDGSIELVCLKNNLHLINSFMMSVNSKVIHQSTPKINEYLNFKKLTETTQNTLNGVDYLNFYPEDDYSLSSKYVIDTNGNVLNKIDQFDSFKNKIQNFDNFDLTNLETIGNFDKTTRSGGIFNSLVSKRVVVTTSQEVNYENYCYIKLSDLSEFCKNVGMARLFVDQLTLYMNMGNVKYTLSAEKNLIDGSTKKYSTVTSSFQNDTCPFYINSGEIFSSAPTAGETLTYTVSIGGNNMIKKNCEIIIPGFELLPNIENLFLETPTRELYFKDVYYTNFDNISAGGSMNFKLNNSIANASGVLIIPYASKNGGVGCRNSPLNVEPNTPSIGINLKNLNVLVGGQPVLLSPSNYNYDMFLNNLENGGFNVINGGFNLESSLLTLRKWNINHRYYYFNCQNLPQFENMSQNIDLRGDNDSKISIDLSVFVIYNRKVVLEKNGGKILELSQS